MVAGEGVAQRIESALARCIGTEQRLLAAMGGPAGEMDEDAAAPRAEVFDGKRGEFGGGQQIDLQRALPDGAPRCGPAIIIGDRRLGLVDGRVVDEHVDPALPGERLLPERLRRRVVREIGADKVAALGRGLRQYLGCLPPCVVVDDDGRAAIEQRSDAARADAARCAGNQYHLAVDADRVVRCAILRHRLPLQFRRPAWFAATNDSLGPRP